MKKQLQRKLDKLNDQNRKDDVITFEEQGVDSLMVDEANYFKNAMVTTKMTRVAGISQTESQKASDMSIYSFIKHFIVHFRFILKAVTNRAFSIIYRKFYAIKYTCSLS